MLPSYNLLSTVFSDPLYKGLDPTELNMSGFHVSGLSNLESRTFLTKNASPTTAPMRAAPPTAAIMAIGALLDAAGGAIGAGAPQRVSVNARAGSISPWQVPFKHRSSVVQRFESSQVLFSASGRFPPIHIPVDGLQTEVLQMLVTLQRIGVPGRHTPWTHKSPTVHELLSALQGLPLRGTLIQNPVAAHME